MRMLALKCILFFISLTLEACTAEPAPIEDEIIVNQSGEASSLTQECNDRDYIASVSDYIIEGRVEKVEAKWNQDKTQIFTYADIPIEKYVKGAPFQQKRLKIVTPGGTVGEISQWVEDQPIFHEGKHVRVYFQAVDGSFTIVCAQFGVEDLDSPSSAAKPGT